MRVAVVPLMFVMMVGGLGSGEIGADSVGMLPAPVIPIRLEMADVSAVGAAQNSNYRPVTPVPYQRKCGTMATDVCATNVTIPPGATGEQLYQMATQAEQQGRKGDALGYLEASAAKGYARAQAAVGIDYADGKGMPRDPQKAVYYLGLAAGQGSRGAQAKLGEMYDKGDGVAVDHARAFEYYRAAAEQHDTNAEFGMGVDDEFGIGVAHDRARAIEYLRRSSADGHDTYGTELADVLAKAPASRVFHSFDEISAYLHPPVQRKAGACGPVPVLRGVMNSFGFSDVTIYCPAHPGCPWQMQGGSDMLMHCAG